MLEIAAAALGFDLGQGNSERFDTYFAQVLQHPVPPTRPRTLRPGPATDRGSFLLSSVIASEAKQSHDAEIASAACGRLAMT
jgi:hypothetical protein